MIRHQFLFSLVSNFSQTLCFGGRYYGNRRQLSFNYRQHANLSLQPTSGTTSKFAFTPLPSLPPTSAPIPDVVNSSIDSSFLPTSPSRFLTNPGGKHPLVTKSLSVDSSPHWTNPENNGRITAVAGRVHHSNSVDLYSSGKFVQLNPPLTTPPLINQSSSDFKRPPTTNLQINAPRRNSMTSSHKIPSMTSSHKIPSSKKTTSKLKRSNSNLVSCIWGNCQKEIRNSLSLSLNTNVPSRVMLHR